MDIKNLKSEIKKWINDLCVDHEEQNKTFRQKILDFAEAIDDNERELEELDKVYKNQQ